MKTTVELPDDLFVSAKKAAAERRTTLRDLIERGLRRELATSATSARRKRIHWVTVDGGLPADLDVADREQLADWIRRNR
jgi:hypothetical protein